MAAVRPLTAAEVALLFTPHDLRRLESYARNLIDWHMILDLLPTVARLFFGGRLGQLHVPRLQAGILLALGLQHVDVDAVAAQFGVAASAVLALFNKVIRKASAFLNAVVEADQAARLDAAAAMPPPRAAAASGAPALAAAPPLPPQKQQGQQGQQRGAKRKHA